MARCERMYECRASACRAVRTRYIYMLIDIRTSMPFYIGQSVEPLRRLDEHIKAARSWADTNYEKSVYIRSLLSDGLVPMLIILDSISTQCQNEAQTLELAYINQALAEGISLTGYEMGNGWSELVTTTTKIRNTYHEIYPYDITNDVAIMQFLCDIYQDRR